MYGVDSDVFVMIVDENMLFVVGDVKCVKGFVLIEWFGECGIVDIMYG